jgi:hypothetical protein
VTGPRGLGEGGREESCEKHGKRKSGLERSSVRDPEIIGVCGNR